jgi:hypothetical protein
MTVLTALISQRDRALRVEQMIGLAARGDRSWVARDRVKYALARLEHDLGCTEPSVRLRRSEGWDTDTVHRASRRAPQGTVHARGAPLGPPIRG